MALLSEQLRWSRLCLPGCWISLMLNLFKRGHGMTWPSICADKTDNPSLEIPRLAEMRCVEFCKSSRSRRLVEASDHHPLRFLCHFLKQISKKFSCRQYLLDLARTWEALRNTPELFQRNRGTSTENWEPRLYSDLSSWSKLRQASQRKNLSGTDLQPPHGWWQI